MHVENLTASGPLTEDDAHDLATVAGEHRPCRITLGSRAAAVHALVLPFCRDELRLAAGEPLTVTVEGPDERAERAALRAFAARLAGVGAGQAPPKTRSTTAFARRVMRR